PTQLHRPEGFNDEAGARWQIGAPGKPVERAWALAYLPVEFPDPELDLAAQEHERGLLVAGVPRPTYTVRGMSYGEAQVFPPGGRGRDFNEHARLVVGQLVGFDKQVWHILLDHVVVPSVMLLLCSLFAGLTTKVRCLSPFHPAA